MTILGEVGGTQAFLTSIVVIFLVPFTYERHHLKVYKEFQKRLLKQDNCDHDHGGHKKKRQLDDLKSMSSTKLFVHDIWTSFKSILSSIWCFRKIINVDSEIWPGINKIKRNIENMLMQDFDLLCVLKTTDMEKDIHELFHLVVKTAPKDSKNVSTLKNISKSFMRRNGIA